MPTYDYVCDSCGHSFEEFQSMTASPLVECPSCGTPSLRRLITGGTGVIFKGNGFYVNDSRSKGENSKKEKKEPAAATSEAGKTGDSSSSSGSGTSDGATSKSASDQKSA